LREVFRRHQHDLKPAQDLVLIARNSIAGKTYAEVENDFVAAAKQGRIFRNRT
jgi:ribonuclease P protein component